MEIICSQCAAKRESPLTKSGKARTPRGWKEIHGSVYCPKCKLAKFALRAVSIPVAKCDWDVIMPLLRQGWRETVQCSNWLLTQLYQRDSLAEAGEKLPAWNVPYLYPEARLKFPAIEPATLAALINTVQSKYRASRLDLWRNNTSLPVYREMPLPVSAQAWKLKRCGADWVFRLRLGGEQRELILRSGAQFYRQHQALNQILAGEVEAGEAALYESGKTLMLKIPGWFPRGEAREPVRTIKARTCGDGFLVAADGDSIWRLNGDHIQRWVVGAAKQQQRLREDLKAEHRFPKRMRAGIVARQAFLSEQRGRRLSSWMHEASAQLVNWAKRRRASEMVWDDTYPSMLPQFPWFTFAAQLQQKCDVAGIALARASEYVPPESTEPLAKAKSV